jgi:hypothetical protein
MQDCEYCGEVGYQLSFSCLEREIPLRLRMMLLLLLERAYRLINLGLLLEDLGATLWLGVWCR